MLFYAEICLHRLKRTCPQLITEGLLRIDIMKTNKSNVIVVNELESLEAMYTSASKSKPKKGGPKKKKSSGISDDELHAMQADERT